MSSLGTWGEQGLKPQECRAVFGVSSDSGSLRLKSVAFQPPVKVNFADERCHPLPDEIRRCHEASARIGFQISIHQLLQYLRACQVIRIHERENAEFVALRIDRMELLDCLCDFSNDSIHWRPWITKLLCPLNAKSHFDGVVI